MEVKVIQPMWHKGAPVKVDEVIDLPPAEAAYLAGIGRVVTVDVPQGKKTAAATKAKAAAEGKQ